MGPEQGWRKASDRWHQHTRVGRQNQIQDFEECTNLPSSFHEKILHKIGRILTSAALFWWEVRYSTYVTCVVSVAYSRTKQMPYFDLQSNEAQTDETGAVRLVSSIGYLSWRKPTGLLHVNDWQLTLLNLLLAGF